MIGLTTAVSGMQAAERRVDASASNIVNAFDTVPHREPVKPIGGLSGASGVGDGLYQPVDVWQSTQEGGGTKAQYIGRDPSRTTEPAPGDPRANDQGLVDRPNVDFANEFVNVIEAQHAYEAAVKAVQTRDQMLGTTIDARS